MLRAGGPRDRSGSVAARETAGTTNTTSDRRLILQQRDLAVDA